MKSDRVLYDLIEHAPLESPPDSYADTIPLPSSTTAPPTTARITQRMVSR